MVSDRNNKTKSGIIAVVGLAIVGLAFGLGIYIASLNYSKEQQYQGYLYVADKSPVADEVALTSNPKPFRYRRPCNNPIGQGESDLCAQWRAAKAAEKSANWTVYGFWATLAGIALLSWQIILTREAVKDTGHATNAMREANRIATEAQRAWIDIQPIFEIRPRAGGRYFLKTHAKFANVGKSVAKNVQIMVRFRTGPFGEAMKAHNTLFREMISKDGFWTLIPGMSMSGGQMTDGFSASSVNWDENERAALCIITIAVYNIDGDDRKRYSRAIWTLRNLVEEFSDGAVGLTRLDLFEGEIGVDQSTRVEYT